MSAAERTLIPTGPQPRVEPVESRPESDLGRALTLVEKLADTAKGSEPVRAAVIAAVIVSGLLWGAHEVLGGRATTERYERMNQRIEKLEEQQTEIRIQLASIARAVGAEPMK